MLEFFCAVGPLARLLSACAAVAAGPAVAGYVEGEYVLLAPPDVAQVLEIPVRRGDRSAKGAAVARLETTDLELAAADARERARQAEAELANLHRGKRPEEIAALEAALNSAEAQARDGERSYIRRLELVARGAASQAELDQAQTGRDVAAAKVRELQANLTVARLPARIDEIAAAEHRAASAAAAAAQAAWRLSKRTLLAPADGRVADVLRRAGETAGPAAPVISFLPDGAAKLKLYLPEALISRAAVGASLAVTCDGCPAGLTARISYVAPEPEFTPPVIYSLDNRQKLVWLVEARPEGAAAKKALQPGQIVDARFLGPAP
jgi:HlyD family secretion protein